MRVRSIRFRAVIVSVLLAAGVAIAAGGAGGGIVADDAALQLVNPLQGTDSQFSLSHGNTLPLLATPWGMTNWAPQTNDDPDGWWFRYADAQIQGIRATRQPSPWIGDYGQFLLMPQTGPAVVFDRAARASPYDRDASTFRPDYLRLQLPRYHVTAELTPTDRCAVLRMTFADGNTGRLIIDPEAASHVEISGREVRGYSTATSGGTPANFKAYFVVQLDRELTAMGTCSGGAIHPGAAAVDGKDVGAYVEFATGAHRSVEARVGTSYISYDQAEQNLKTETAAGFDAVRETTRRQWQTNLGKIDLSGGTPEQRRTFYSCFYRAQLFPHRLYELDDAGKPTHFSPYDGGIHPGLLYGDNGFWDVYRTNYPFWSILFPQQLGEILQGFVQAYQENGWFPQWPSPGNRVSMIGSHVDAVIADAVVKHIPGFDIATAYAGIRKDAFEAPPADNVGRPGLGDYLKLGFVPVDHGAYPASTSLDYAYDDWCVAQVAKVLGKTDDYTTLMKRSQNYKRSWDPSVGFFRGRHADGSWAAPFDPFAWGGAYVEGGPWQCSWAVQHDVDGLADLLGGKPAMADKLDRLLGLPPVFHVGAYHQVIHEMTEMAHSRFGQYAQSNQPSHHILYLYAAIGQPWKTQYWTRQVCQELYNSGPDGFPGDEDNGEMSCWYLLSSMGFYPLCVGDPTYTLTSPLFFGRVTLHLPDGKTFNITTKNNSHYDVYVAGRTLNGRPFDGTTISHAAILAGGELNVQMSPQPDDSPRPSTNP